MRCYLHTGNYKTGSTSLQSHMAKNQKLLLEKGIYYGDFCEAIQAHANLSYGILREALQEFGLWKHYKEHQVFDLVAEDPQGLLQKMFQHAKYCHTIVISHESIFSELYRTMAGLEVHINEEENDKLNQWMRERYYKLLSFYSNDIKTIHYIRRQDLYAESQYNQYCKAPWYGALNLPEFHDFLSRNPVSFDYKKQLDGWKSVFGKERMIVRVYEREQMPNGIYEDFYEGILGFSKEEWSHFLDVSTDLNNIRIGRDILEVKRKMSGVLPVLGELLCKYALETGDTKEYAYFTEQERKDFLLQYEDGNKYVAKEYLERPEGMLFFDTNMQFPQYQGLTPSKMQKVMDWLSKELALAQETLSKNGIQKAGDTFSN